MKYALQRAREAALALIAPHVPPDTPLRLELPPPEVAADLGLPCFQLAKTLRRAPPSIAADLADAVRPAPDGPIALASAAGGYLNFQFNWDAFARAVVEDVVALGERYGGDEAGAGRTVVFDLSAPNIAKPMSVGHLRSTVIGDALRHLYAFRGYRTVGINHLGDWGTQFGKIIFAFREWGDTGAMRQDPIAELLRLYVRFHEEEESRPNLEERGREWFRRLEEGDPEARRLWQEFRALSVAELERIYALLGVSFDSWHGEAFFEDKMAPVVAAAEQRGLAVESEGALVVPLEDAGIRVPLMLRKRDGASTYATRDLAAALYRIREYSPSLILYVVGGDQRLHFQQVFETLRRLGCGDTRFVHVDFGMITLPEGRMRTRSGRVILLEDVLEEAIRRAQAIVAEKNPQLPPERQEETARMIGIGAVKYADLSQDRVKAVVFDWDRMLSLDGDAAPYLMYSYVRTRSVLRKASQAGQGKVDGAVLALPAERALLKRLSLFPEAVREATDDFAPHTVANYVYELARLFSDFWRDVPVLRAETPELLAARLFLVRAVGDVMRTGLGLLGIDCPEQM